MELILLLAIGVGIFWLFQSGEKDEDKWRSNYRDTLLGLIQDPSINIFGVTSNDVYGDIKAINAVPAFKDFVLLSDYRKGSWHYPQDAANNEIYLAKYELVSKLDNFKEKVSSFSSLRKDAIYAVKKAYLIWYLDLVPQPTYDVVIEERSAINRQIINRDKSKCVLCGHSKPPFHVHHVILRARGGTDDPGNLVTLCIECHKSLPFHDLMRKPASLENIFFFMINIENILRHIYGNNSRLLVSTLEEIIALENPLKTHPSYTGFDLESIFALLVYPERIRFVTNR